MMRLHRYGAMVMVVLAVALVVGCGSPPAGVTQNSPQDEVPNRPGAGAAVTADAPPLYQLNEAEVDAFLNQLHRSEPDLRRRIITIARRNLGQPYELYLLGESPFESIDAQPVYCLDRSDCVVYAEHALAMAMSDNWRGFMAMLQRIRYTNGHISVLTRNHYTEADWNRQNRWLVRDITEELAGEERLVRFRQKVDRAKFFKDRYKLETSIPVETIDESFIPYEHIDSIKSQLRDGDVVNFVSGRQGNYWVGHVGLVALGTDGTVNLIHSAAPAVREEPIDEYIRRSTASAAERDAQGQSRFRGFKFLRINDDPLAQLRAIDGSAAPRVTVPAESPVTWEQYLESFNLGG